MKLRARSLAVWKALTSVIGLDEVLLALALGLVTAALWPLAVRWVGTGLPALLAPGLVIAWLVLPSRAPFVAHHPEPEKPNTARRT